MTGRLRRGLLRLLGGAPSPDHGMPEPVAVPGQAAGANQGVNPRRAITGDRDVDARSQETLARTMRDFDQLLDGMNKAAERDGFGEDGPMAPTLQALRLCMLALREMAASVLRIT